MTPSAAMVFFGRLTPARKRSHTPAPCYDSGAMRTRNRQPEVMDDPTLPERDHHRALARLDLINALSLAARPIANQIISCTNHAPPVPPPPPLSILDIATGSGRVACAVAARLARRKISTHLTLTDISQTAVDLAAAHARTHDLPASTLRFDVLSEPIPLPDQSIDFAISSLFLHHLPEPNVTILLREMARVARHRVIISDLRRCAPGHALASAAGMLSGSRIVRIDAPRSVEGSFTPAELLHLAHAANLQPASVRRIYPYRMLLVWTRPTPEHP